MSCTIVTTFTPPLGSSGTVTNPDEVQNHGGQYLCLTGSWPAGTYTVHIGPEQGATARTAYNGIPGSGGTNVTFVDDGTGSGDVTACVYTPPVRVGGPYQIYLGQVGSGPASRLINRYVVSRPRVFQDKAFSMCKLLPRHWKKGPCDEASAPDYDTLFSLAGGLSGEGAAVAVKYSEYGAGNVTVASDDTTVAKTGVTSGGDTVTLYDPSGLGAGNKVSVIDAGGNATWANPIKITSSSGLIWDGKAYTNTVPLWGTGGEIEFESTGTNYIARYRTKQVIVMGDTDGTSVLAMRGYMTPEPGGHFQNLFYSSMSGASGGTYSFDFNATSAADLSLAPTDHFGAQYIFFDASSTDHMFSNNIPIGGGTGWWPTGDTSWSVAVWYYVPTAIVSSSSLIANWVDATGTLQYWDIGFDGSDQIYHSVRNAAGSATVTATGGVVTPDALHCVVASHDASADQVKLHHDGVAVTPAALVGGTQAYTGGAVLLGSRGTAAAPTNHTDARVYGVALFNSALTDAQITGLWSSGNLLRVYRGA